MYKDLEKQFLSTRDAAKLLGYTHDYVSKMCREGYLKGRQVGRSWFIEITSLEEFKKNHESRLESHKTGAALRALRGRTQAPKTRSFFDGRCGVAYRIVLMAAFLVFSGTAYSGYVDSRPALSHTNVIETGLTFFDEVLNTPSASTAHAVGAEESQDLMASVYSAVASFFDWAGKTIASLFATPIAYAPTEEGGTSTQATTTLLVTSGPTSAYLTGTSTGPKVTNNYFRYVTENPVSYVYGGATMEYVQRAIENLRDDLKDREDSGSGGSGGIADISGESLEDLADVGSMTKAFGDLLGWDGTLWTNFSTSTLAIDLSDTTGALDAVRGGTGQTSFVVGDVLYADTATTLARLPVGSNGQVLKISGGLPSWGADASGGGGAGAFATSSDNLSIYPADASDVVIIGAAATSTTGNILEVAGNALFRNSLSVYGTLTGPRFVATSSTASVFPYASTTGFSSSYASATSAFIGTLGVNGETFTDLTGTGLQNVGGALTLNATGDWTGTFDGQEGDWYRANSFSTTSADYLATQRNFFSTTSADYWETQQTARTADDLTNNSIEDLSDVAAMTENFGDLLGWNGSTWTDFATSSLGISSFSTTSADYWKSVNNFYSTTSADYYVTQRNFFSTSSASYFLSQNQNSAFSTSSSDYWQTQRNFFSTTSSEYWKSISNFYSTTSADYYITQRNFFSTSSAGYFLSQNQGSAFSTTSSDFWKSINNFYSTTSADYYVTQRSFFSTTSSDFWQTQRNFFSTSSANYWETQQTARSADDLTNNSIEDLSDVVAMTENFGDLLYWNGTGWADIATSSLGLTVNTAGDWTGTFDGQEGDWYRANSFSTTSADVWQTNRNFFSTTSADYWETQQTARTADDLTNNSIEDLSDVAVMTENFGDLLYWNGSAWADIATSSLSLLLSDTLGTLPATRGGTGQTDYVAGDLLYADSATTLTRLPVGTNGEVLKLVSGLPSWEPDLTTGGGGSGAWATTTDSLAIYPSDTSDVVVIGASATSTSGSILEVFGRSYFSNLLGIGTTSPSVSLSVQGNGLFSGNISTANLSATGTATVTAFAINNDLFTDLTGTGLQNVGGALSINATGDWTGTFDGQEGDWYRANSFSTTSADYLATQRNFFSTTSADYWETQQTARTADDLTNNSIEDLSDVAAMTENFGDLLGWNGSTWTDFATSSLGLPTFSSLGSYLALTDWYATTTDGLDEGLTNLYYTDGRAQTYLDTVAKGYFFSTTSADYWKSVNNFFSTTSALAFNTSIRDWSILNGVLSPTTTLGIGVYASSTIGNGTDGLTISGNATTTGQSRFIGSVRYDEAVVNYTSFNAFRMGSARFSLPEELGIGDGTNSVSNPNILMQNVSGSLGLSTGNTTFTEQFRFASSGSFGIGTTSPYARLSVHTMPGMTGITAFNISSSTLTATTSLFSVDTSGNATLFNRFTAPYASTTGFSSIYSSSTNLTAGNLTLGDDLFTDLTGTGLQNSGGALSINATGDWTGTFDGQEGDWYRANSFSTTSADVWAGLRNFFSTTSADYWETQQTARTADDLTNNSIEDLSDVAAMTENFGDLLYWNGSAWADIATSSLGITGGGSGTVGSGTTGQIPYYAANGTTLTATSSLTVSTAGRIGAGTSSPAYLFDAHATTATQNGNYVAFFSRANGVGGVRLGANNGVGIIGGASLSTDTGSQGLAFRVMDSGTEIEAARFSNTANFGVGTTSPYAKLSVHGTPGSPTTLFNVSSSTLTATSSILSVFSSGSVAVGTTTASVGTSLKKFAVETNPGPTDAYGALYGAVYFTPTASHSGGATATFGDLQVYGSEDYASALIGLGGRVFHNGTGILSDVRGTNLVGRNISSGTITSLYGFNAEIYNDSTGVITAGRAGRFIVNNAVGASYGDAYGTYIDVANSGTMTNTYGVYVDDITSGTQTNTPYSFYAADGSALNYFAGNVGVGTTTPSYAIHAYSTGVIVGGISGNSSSAQFEIESTATGGKTYRLVSTANTSAVGGGRFGVLDTSLGATGYRLLIDSSGNIGIGTTSPFAKLSVHTTPGSGTTAFNISSSTLTATTSLFSIDTSGNASLFNRFTSAYASTTGFSSVYASSSAAHLGTLSLKNLSDGCLSITSGLVGSQACGGGGDWPFTTVAHGGTTTQATTSVLWFQFGLHASSTSAFNDVLASRATTTAATSTTFYASAQLGLASDRFTDLTGTGLQNSGGALTLNATGDWTGTLDSIDGASFLRSDATDSYTSGTLTFDAATSLDLNTTGLSIADTSVTFDGASTNFAFTGNFAANTDDLFILKSNGNIGIATTTPIDLLSIYTSATAGAINLGVWDSLRNGISLNGNDASSATGYNLLSGVGDTNLYLNRPSGSSIKFREANGGTDQFTLLTGGSAIVPDGNLSVCAGGACPTGTPAGNGNLIVETAIGVATSTPWAALSLASGKAIVVAESTAATSSSMSIDWRNGNQQLVRIGGAGLTISFSNFIEGQKLVLTVCNPSTTAGAITWGTQVLWPGGTAPTQTTTANKCDIWSFLATKATSTLKIFGSQSANF